MGLTQKLGTIPLAIQTDSSNNVGIGGAANASYKLAVTGAATFSSSATFGGNVTLGSLTSGGQGGINGASGTINRAIVNCPYPGASALTLGYYSSAYGLDIWVNGDGTGLAPAYIDQRNAEAIIFRRNTQGTAVESLRITDTGNLGLGTAAPAMITTGSRVFEVSGAGDYFPAINIARTGGSTKTNANWGFVISTDGGLLFRHNTSGSNFMGISTNGNRTFTGPGGTDQMFSAVARAANGDYVDINTQSGGGNFQGFLIVANTYAYNGAYRTQGTYSVLGRDTTISATGLSVVNGPTGSSTYSITSPSTGIIRITNTGLYGDLIVSWRGFV